MKQAGSLRQNNFDLIRLAAAFQVMLIHGVEHLHAPLPATLVNFLNRFPGVPIFFVISGFLISASYERNSDIGEYARNRALRIYPALLVCLLFSILTAIGYLLHTSVTVRAFALWLVAQTTIFQFYRPGFLDGYATGTLNGSLWTIPVELQFYILLPLLYLTLRRSTHKTAWLLGMALLCVAANLYRYGDLDLSNTLFARVVKMNVIPYLYMFLLGAVAQRSIARLMPFVRGKFLYWLTAYIATSYLTGYLGLAATENAINPLSVLVLSGTVLSAAFTAPALGEHLLRRNDISYGIYIYHMPVANLLIYLSIGTPWQAYALMTAATVVLGMLSWRYVERPALKFKVDALRPVSRAASS